MKLLFTIVTVFIVLLFLPEANFAQAVYDTVSIHDLQWVPNPDSSDASLYLGDTVVVGGYVQHSPRELWVGARWACYITDGTQDPWSGFFIIQDDTFVVNTLFGFVQEGDFCYFTGRVASFTGLTQLNLLTNPPVPITIVSSGNPLPDVKVLTCVDLETHGAGEQWESMKVRIENALVTNNNFSGNIAVITDGTGNGYIDDYFWYYRSQFNAGFNPWPSNNTNLNIIGFTRDVGSPYFTVNPRDDSYFEILTNPPVISEDIIRNPGVPLSTDNVVVSTEIVDNGSVASAELLYSVNWGPFNTVTMSMTTVDTFVATIPSQANNAYVRYFIKATDNVGETSQLPGDTSRYIFSYVIRDQGLDIKDVQYTWGYPDDSSPFEGYEVTLQGVVMTDPADWTGNYYIQEKDSAWYGMWISDPNNTPVQGDLITVTGEVQENFGVTRLRNLSNYAVVTPGVGVFNPVTVTTGEIGTGGANAEAYEDVLIRVLNVIVTDPFPDAPSNFGEFEIDDSSGPVRVDDAFTAFNGNQDSTFQQNDTIEQLIGMHYYSFGDYKILPRNNNDIIGHVSVGIEDELEQIAQQFTLSQNYPNPFNPVTHITFNAPKTTQVKIAVYDILGRQVKVLYNAVAPAGSHTISWDATKEAGTPLGSGIYFYQLQSENVTLSKKMILVK
ncbi:MAG: T9SS type A sorting domain-containing protein [bacterium]|nr:MAG: T9SS type A sorting domain-containing protein [bacterium]